jgi:UDP:flavonoid glycosyltransferase YjiC (YdhE family)
MKNICLAAIGTRGDVMPVLSLAKLLTGQNKVTVICPPGNRQPVHEQNLQYLEIGDDFSDVVKAGNLPYFREQVELQFNLHHDAYKNADLIIGAGLFYSGRTIAESLNKKYYHIFYTPQVLKSKLHAPPGSKNPFGNQLTNRLLWFKSIRENDLILKKLIDRQRSKSGLPAIKNVYQYFIDRPNTIIAADECLQAIPSEYMDRVKQINFLYSKDSGSLSLELKAFLGNGSKPISINFGSAENISANFRNLLKSTIETVLTAGYRAVVITKIRFDEYDGNGKIIFTDYAPHQMLFDNSAAVIHHGGIGTVYSALRSGTPQIIVPQMLDQFYWSEIISNRNLGISLRCSKDKQYGISLAESINHLLNSKKHKENIEDMKTWLNRADYRKESLSKLKAAIPECILTESDWK